MQREGSDEGEPVDVAEVDFAAEEEEGAEEEEEEDGACEVGVVHYVLGYRVQGVEDCERLAPQFSMITLFTTFDLPPVASRYSVGHATARRTEDVPCP